MKRIELYNDSFQNFRGYQLPKAQLIIADVPYNLGNNAYASNPAWYNDGDNQNGESELAGKQFFNTDSNFRPAEFMHFCSHMLRKEPKVGVTEDELENAPKVGSKMKSQSPCMILFCGFDQLHYFIDLGKRYGLMRNIPLVFRKNYSAQVLKANMKIVGNCEYGLLLYRDRLPKFNNNGNMVFNCMEFPRETRVKKIHPTQKPIALLERLIELFTDPDDVVIDPVAGSGSTLLAAANLGRKAYGFEIDKNFYREACKFIEENIQPNLFSSVI